MTTPDFLGPHAADTTRRTVDAGEVVQCSKCGAEICTVAVDIRTGTNMASQVFKDWKTAPPRYAAEYPLTHDQCGGVWLTKDHWNGGNFAIYIRGRGWVHDR